MSSQHLLPPDPTPADLEPETKQETPKDPPPEPPANIRIRTLVVFSFWAVVLALGIPLWWLTTSIYRAQLPLKEMQSWADGRVYPLKLHLEFPELIGAEYRHVEQNSLYTSMWKRRSSAIPRTS